MSQELRSGPRPSVVIAIVNWNGREHVLECLSSVAALDYPPENLRVMVVDNGSTDGSIEAISEKYPEVEVLSNRENLGYVKALNQGVVRGREMGAEFIWPLNNDVTVDRDTLSRLVAVGEANERIGVIGPLVYSYDDPDRVDHAGYRINLWTGRLTELKIGKTVFQRADQEVAEVDSILGCANLIRSTVFDEIGLLREIYEVYFEETDFNARVRNHGHTVAIARRARVWHKGAATMNRFILRRAYLLLRNLLIFELLNAKPKQLVTFLPYYLFVHTPYFLVRGSIYGLNVVIRG